MATKKENTKPPPWKSLIAGGIAGSIEAGVTYPFEFAKTRLQLVDRKSAATTTKNPIKLIGQVARAEGIGAIYAGCSTLVIGCGFKAAVRFLGFDTIKKALADKDGKLSGSKGILAGLGAGVLESVVAVTPFETIKTALIDDARSGQPKYRGFLHGSASLIRENGLSGVYKGLLPVTLRQASNSAVRMGSYNAIKVFLQQRSPDPSLPLSSSTTFAVGAVAGIITVYTTMPVDTVKTRMQALNSKDLYSSTWDCAKKVYSQEGVLTFWKGTTPRLGRLILSGGIIFTIYEKVMLLLS